MRGALTEVIPFEEPERATSECMNFTLVYWNTQLRPSGNKSLPWEKHRIRRDLSSQLERLWEVHSVLRGYDQHKKIQGALAKRFERSGTEYVPLVVADIGLVCDLDITFLRPEEPGKLILESGDIDNRIKTLLDALRVPTDGSEAYLKPEETKPERIYCLLENDSLVTQMQITTDRLLVPDTSEKFEACLLIRVNVRGLSPLTPYEFRGA